MVILQPKCEMKSRFLNMPGSLREGLLIGDHMLNGVLFFFSCGKFSVLVTGVIHHNLE